MADAPSITLHQLTIDQAVTLLRAAGSTIIDADLLRADIAAGAPVHADGTISLVAYGAWLLRELARLEDARGR
jgi:hypothetical protein